MTAILYLAHDLDDNAIWRRVSMLKAGGAEVTLAGFRRDEGALPGPAIVLGKTQNGRMVQRAGLVARAVRQAARQLGHLDRPDVILARNLEMLAVGARTRGLWTESPGLAYEVLDIHRMMLGGGLRARGMRAVERRLARGVGMLVTSSPGFVREYFTPYRQLPEGADVRIVENKVNGFDLAPGAVALTPELRGVPTIGWFGILRCARSLEVLDAATRARPGSLRVLLAGRPALDVIPDFHARLGANPDLDFVGPYRNPDDLGRLYGAVDFAWLVDRYEAGQNSDWLLPNRLYEGGLYGAIPLALQGTEVARRVAELGIGVVLPHLTAEDVGNLIATLGTSERASLRAAMASVPRNTWVASRKDAQALVRALGTLATGNVRSDSGNALLKGAIR